MKIIHSWHDRSVKQVLEALESTSKGLSDSQISSRASGGANELPRKKPDAWWQVLARQFMSPLIIILLVASLVTALMHEWVDTGVILAAVLVNTIIGFIQEYRSSHALEQLRSMVQPTARVIRDGAWREIDARSLVVGDILLLGTGDQVSADARVIECVDLVMNESALTGESSPVSKTIEVLKADALMAERINMVYAGTTVTAGRGMAVVVAIGASTELGAIATLVGETGETQTPLQEQLASLARGLSLVVLFLVVLVFAIGMARGGSLFEMFEMSVALAVAAIPEGLVVAVTVILAIGMQRILKRGSLVRRLVGAETLGSVSVICSDKTGTITEGEMRLTDVITAGGRHQMSASLADTAPDIAALLQVLTLCNDAAVVQTPEGEVEVVGSPTERAIIEALLATQINLTAVRAEYERVGEVPFDSAYKYMMTANRFGEQTRVLLKGAPMKVLPACTHEQINGKTVELTRGRLEEQQAQVEALTGEGLRLIAVAQRQWSRADTAICHDDLENFTFLGFIGLHDPLRPEAKEQIAAAHRAGVRTVIITGDHPQTARVIGRSAGLVAREDQVVIGSDIDNWSDEELHERVKDITIYARVEPRHKIRIVSAWRSRGEVVAMTGDGVNDAPALQAADIGIALGSGTEVAKQVADVVLLDNNLSTITAAIEEGRIIFDNIRKSTVYLLAGSFTELTLIAGALLLGLPLPITVAQILWINLVADSFPGVGLMMEPGEDNVMARKPRGRKEPVLGGGMGWIVALIAVTLNVGLFSLYLWLLSQGIEIEAMQSIMFAAVSIDSLLFIFAVRSFHRTIFTTNPFSNPYLNVGVMAGFALMLLALLHPTFQVMFDVVPLRLSDWGLLLMMGLVKLFIIEIGKHLFIIRHL